MAGVSSQSLPLLPGCSSHISMIFKDDTGNTFSDHLIADLRQAGLLTVQDNQMIDSIQQSNICIIIFSDGFFSSEGLLDKFVKILDFYGPSRIVPVYFNVDRSDVRHQLGSVGEAFSVFETGNEDDVSPLREALKKVVNIPGYNVGNVANGSQSEEGLTEKIAREMKDKVNRVVCPPKPLAVGLDSRANPLNCWMKDA